MLNFGASKPRVRGGPPWIRTCAVMLYFQELHIELNLRVSYLNNASFYDWPLDYHKSKNSKKNKHTQESYIEL